MALEFLLCRTTDFVVKLTGDIDMAKCCITVPQTDITVSKSVARNVVKDLVKMTGFPSDAEIIIDDNLGDVRAKTGFANPCDIPVRVDGKNYVFVTITERYTEEGTVINRHPNHYKQPVFQDKDLGVRVEPVYSQRRIELAIRFRTRDLTTMRSWLAAMRVNDSFQNNKFFHNVKYDYSLPKPMLDFIVDTWKMSEAVAPRNKTLKEFVTDGFSDGLHKRKNISGSHVEYVINEIQTGVHGLKDNDYPYNEYTQEDGVYELQYPYFVTYDHVDACTLETPVIIHNQLIDKRYIELFIKRQNPGYQPFGYRESGWTVDDLASGEFERFYKGDGGSRLLEYDDFFPNEPRANTATVFLAPVIVSDVEPNKVVSLSSLNETLIPKPIMDYIIAYPERVKEFRRGIVSIEVYEIYSAERRLEVDIDENLNVRTLAPMYQSRRNYVKVDVFKDFSVFGTGHTRELLKQAEILKGLIWMLDPTQYIGPEPDGDGIKQNPDGSLDGITYTNWLRRQKTVNRTFREYKPKVLKTVQSSSVIARRLNQ